MIPRLRLPLPPWVLVLIGAAFLLPGLTGHDPWKSADAIGIGIVHHMAASGDWLVPRIAGEPWLADSPLYHWVALAFARALGWTTGFHNAARLASGLFTALAFVFLWYAARATAEPARRGEAGATAVLVLLGSVGLIVHAHEAIPDLAALAAIAGLFLALARAEARPLAAGVGAGAALGACLLTAGMLPATALAATTLLACVATPALRNRAGLGFTAAALAVFALVSLAWLGPLAYRSPELLSSWWLEVTTRRGEPLANARYFLSTITWFAWPAWPLALWTLWMERKRLSAAQRLVPALSAVFLFVAISVAGPAQSVSVLVLLVPLALLAAPGVMHLRRGAANALDWFGVMTFGFFAGLVWLGYVAMMTGVPPRIARNFAKTAPGFLPEFEWPAFLLALAFTLAWALIVFGAAPSPTRGVTRWAAGVTLLWGSFAMLWMPWADYQKSYQGVALQLRASLPAGNKDCIARRSLGTPQRAALSYHGGILTVPWDASRPEACPFLLVQGNPRHELEHPGTRWRKLADLGRPGDKSERYRLYRLEP